MATDDLRVDWNNDGDYSDTGENVSARVLARDPVQVRYGRDQARAGSPIAVGEMSFSLNNVSRDYSPENTSSPLNGLLRPGRPVKYERTHGSVVLRLIGATGSYASTPDHASLDITADIDLRARVGLDSWNTGAVQPLVTKWTTTGAMRSYSLQISATGAPQLGLSPDGSSGASVFRTGDVLGYPSGTVKWIRATLDADNGATQNVVTFYTSDNGSSWTQHGTAITTAGIQAIKSGTANLMIGTRADDGLFTTGDVYAAQVYSGIAGTLVANPDFTAQTSGTTSFADSTPKTWTVSSPARIIGPPYTMFRGHLDDYQVVPAPLERAVQFTCMDVLGRLREARISTALHHGISTGQAIGLILDEIGWPEDERDLDTGATTIRWWWEEDADAWDAVTKVVQSEGPAALVTVGPSGEFVFRDRHHRLTTVTSTTSQATFRDTGAEPKFSAPFTYDHGWRDIVNSVQFTVDDRSPLGLLSAVWTSDQSVSIPAGGSVSVVASTSDPFYGAVTPVSGTDYQAVSGTATASLSRDSGASTTITYSAVGGAAVVNTLQLRAYSVPVRTTVQVGADEPGSISNYGLRSYTQDAPWAGVWDAQALADLIVGHRYERLPIVSFRVASGSDTATAVRLAQQLARDLSDRVTVVDSETGLNADFHIEQIAHTVAQAGRTQDTVFGCEKVATLPTDVMILDTGLLGTNTLGAIGLDDPNTILLVDSGLLGTGRLAY